MARVPEVGDILTEEDFDMILEAVQTRQKNFPGEPVVLSMGLVFLNIGKRFTPVTCLEEEWTGVMQDIPKGEGDPKCPNGHPIRQGKAIALGWVEVPV